MNDIITLMKRRLKEVKRSGKKNPTGRIYLPKELVGTYVSYITYQELQQLERDIRRYRTIMNFMRHLLDSKNHTKMFSVISETWNPITGCTHYCIYCWARRLALTKLKNSKKYKDGFLPKLHPEEFKKKFKGGMVFVTDMGDLFSNGVPDEWIIRVIEHIKKFPNTYFLFLTKNPIRYLDFIDRFPPNAILGATIETNRDELYLNHSPRISLAPLPSLRYKVMKELKWDMKFVSIEPILDFDLEEFVEWIREINPFLVYVGYDNYNWKLPEPPLSKTLKLIRKISEFTLVVKKTIRPAWNESIINYKNKSSKS